MAYPSVDPTALPTPAAQPNAPREVSDEDKKFAAEWLKRIQEALTRPGIKAAHEQFEKNRKLLRGRGANDQKMQANLYFANLATMRPQVYAKDPEYACKPSAGVPQASLPAAQKLAEVSEALLGEHLVKRTKLKKRAKRLLTSAYTTSVGWFKLCWQENKKTDPLITNQIKDIQDNLQRIAMLQQQDEDPGSDHELKKAELEQTLAGLQGAEIKVARGLTNDFVLSEDIVILDDSVREIGDYERAAAIAHRVWMTPDAYQGAMGYKIDKGKRFTEASGQIKSDSVTSGIETRATLLCVWEIWDQDSNRVFTVCDGEDGFCKPPESPNWTGERWYPFFMAAFNEIEGTFYPLSDIELTQPQIEEINETAQDFKRDRKGSLPLNVVRKGGALTDDDLQKLKKRQGSDIIVVEGVGGQPLTNDIFSGQLSQLRPENYDTTQARTFMEQMVGGGDAARGTVQKAKTATEAEILSQGLQGRSGERRDVIEDLLTEMGVYALQILMRKLTPEEVAEVAGPEAQEVWPTATNIDKIFKMVSVEVRGGSTGKPNQGQEQERWTQLLPVIEKTVQQVSELRQNNQNTLAEALTELLRETLRRFDERIDIEQFLPPPPDNGKPNPEQLMQENGQLKEKLQQLMKELTDAQAKVEKGYITAAAQVAISLNPTPAAAAFGVVLQTLESGQMQPGMPPAPPGPPQVDPAAMAALQAQHQQLQEAHGQLQQEHQQLQTDKSTDLQKHALSTDAEIQKAHIDGETKVRVAAVVAPIEADAKVRVAHVQKEAQVEAAKHMPHPPAPAPAARKD